MIRGHLQVLAAVMPGHLLAKRSTDTSSSFTLRYRHYFARSSSFILNWHELFEAGYSHLQK